MTFINTIPSKNALLDTNLEYPQFHRQGSYPSWATHQRNIYTIHAVGNRDEETNLPWLPVLDKCVCGYRLSPLRVLIAYTIELLV